MLLVAATTAAYLPAIRGGYIWDDDSFVTDNAILQGGPDSLRRIWLEFRATDQYYPMAYSSFWLEYRLWGYNPLGSHIVNVLLHVLNALLLWQLLRVLKVPGAWIAAFVFALHPVEVESVAWITERKNVLSTSFYFLAFLAYLRFCPLPEARRDWRFYPLVILLFFCACGARRSPARCRQRCWWCIGGSRTASAGAIWLRCSRCWSSGRGWAF